MFNVLTLALSCLALASTFVRSDFVLLTERESLLTKCRCRKNLRIQMQMIEKQGFRKCN